MLSVLTIAAHPEVVRGSALLRFTGAAADTFFKLTPSVKGCYEPRSFNSTEIRGKIMIVK